MKMKKIVFYVFVMLVPVLNSCTQADGYIGPWFGSWHLEEILINDQEDTDYNQDIMICFQGDIFKFGYLDRAEIYGMWEYEGEVLTLDASFKAGGSANITYLFNPFPVVMRFPADVDQVEITVTSINNRYMQWQYIDQNGRLLTYNFKKYP